MYRGLYNIIAAIVALFILWVLFYWAVRGLAEVAQSIGELVT